VAVGSPRDRLGIVDVAFAGRLLAWAIDNLDRTPNALNLLAPELPTKRELLEKLRRTNPDLLIVWLPRAVLLPVSWLATGLQKLMRPGRPAVSLARVFAVQRYDTSTMRTFAGGIAPHQTAVV
jgi:hypothetical protein